MNGTTRAYLDHNATAPIRPVAAEEMARALGLAGNPSSVHAEGRAARALVEEAREAVAALAGARPRDVVFTSGGTEAAAAALAPGLSRQGRAAAPASLLLVSATEHPCVCDGHRFPAGQVETIPVDAAGLVDLGWLERRLARHGGAALVSVHAANNETGVLQPLAAVGALARRHGALFHSDAVQALGRVAIDYRAAGVDALTISAHKLGGPKGVGALVFTGEGVTLAEPLLRGGGQERGLRGGTENVPGIAGFGAAARATLAGLEAEKARLSGLRDGFEAGLMALAPQAVIFGREADRLPNTCAFAISNVSAERAVILFDLAGVAVSSGSACSSGKVRRSHVLQAMGVPERLAECALRVSFGWSSVEADATAGLAAVAKLAKTCKEGSQAAA